MNMLKMLLALALLALVTNTTHAQTIYTNVTAPAPGTTFDPGKRTITVVYGTSVAGIDYCIQVFKGPNSTTPIKSVQVPINSESFDLDITLEADSSYLIKVVPCDPPAGSIVTAGSVGITVNKAIDD